MNTLGKYQILEKIGSGGFGEVFKGYDPYIKRHVAVKTCLTDDQEIRNRFFQEAEIAGNLQHRNITTIYDFGLEGTVPYLIQEYLSGEDLDQKIKRKDFLPYPEKLYYLLQVARGLAFAHMNGVIHRDIKPANIRVLEDGTTKIMDFGIAKLTQRDTSLTQTGMTLGTAAYLAPEQIRGEPVDHRTDVFSFGILTYELLTYERPFQGDQISAVIYQILHQEPKAIREHWPSVPGEMVDLIERCLSKTAAERFENAAALLRQLEVVQKTGRAERPGSAEPAAPPQDATRDQRPAGPRTAPAPAAPRSPTGATRTAPAEAPGAGLDDLELSAVRIAETRSGPQRVTGTQSSPVLKYVFLAVLCVVALAVGIQLGTSDDAETDSANGAEAPPSGSETPGSETVEEATDVAQAPGGQASPPPPERLDTVDVARPEAAPPPPTTQPGTLWIVKPAWTDAIAVKVPGRSVRELDRDRSFTLAPGDYSVTFELHLSDYQASVSVQAEVGESGRTTLEVPIAQPGLLTARALPGRPQAQILLDGVPIGKSPLRGRKVKPGPHQVLFQPDSGEEGLEWGVVIQPGQETVLTFDLGTGDVREKT